MQDHDDMLLQQYLLLCPFFERAYINAIVHSLLLARQARLVKLSFLSTGLDNKDLEATTYTHLLPVTRMQKLNVILGLCTAITANLIPGYSGASVSTKVAGAAPVENLYSLALSSRSVQYNLLLNLTDGLRNFLWSLQLCSALFLALRLHQLYTKLFKSFLIKSLPTHCMRMWTRCLGNTTS